MGYHNFRLYKKSMINNVEWLCFIRLLNGMQLVRTYIYLYLIRRKSILKSRYAYKSVNLIIG